MQNILIFNDISGLGNNSMVANVSVFSRLGHYCMPVPYVDTHDEITVKYKHI